MFTTFLLLFALTSIDRSSDMVTKGNCAAVLQEQEHLYDGTFDETDFGSVSSEKSRNQCKGYYGKDKEYYVDGYDGSKSKGYYGKGYDGKGNRHYRKGYSNKDNGNSREGKDYYWMRYYSKNNDRQEKGYDAEGRNYCGKIYSGMAQGNYENGYSQGYGKGHRKKYCDGEG